MQQPYKKLLFIALLFINFQFTEAQSQSKKSNTIEITTQKELEAFGKKGLSKFEGNLIISGASDLSPLATLVEIEGKLVIGDHTPDGIVQNPELTSLNGLQNLTKVGRHLSFHSNPKLENLDALKNLIHIGETINIMDNASLVSIKGLDNVTHIGGSINIWLNGKLEAIDTFYNITEVKEHVSIYDNESLHDLSGFSNIKKIEKNLTIEENDALIKINGFDALETVQNRFVIESNSYAVSIDAFKNLKSVGFLQLSNNTRLKTVCGFRNLKISKENTKIKYNERKFIIVDGMFDVSDCN
ncbi:hypothetical protein H2O64_13025 [Kordia sp. YSTF-M3]|uniref:Receptor L-domain domain-containing protein n=1 Tax=Kordia aestuariivivens TaxID=2759037 RepID=A0ABR7QAS3_9FLAO|nr:hypothetical protein [Kordia aestuariivivens]MBC8755593.1 hypothetical protein [Kordia aestuariivivens]